eukprot:m.6259 g.6259  ORF g.6259 m.6259 type:complete len:263 (+) comp15385_c0_seq1:933-1721(+)
MMAMCFDLWSRYTTLQCQNENTSNRTDQNDNLWVSVHGQLSDHSNQNWSNNLHSLFGAILFALPFSVGMIVCVILLWISGNEDNEDNEDLAFLGFKISTEVVLIVCLIVLLKATFRNDSQVHLETEDAITIISGMALPVLATFIAAGGILYLKYYDPESSPSGAEANTTAASTTSAITTTIVASFRAIEGILQTLLILQLAAEWRKNRVNRLLVELSKFASALVMILNFVSFFIEMFYEAHYDVPTYRAKLMYMVKKYGTPS